MIIDQPHIDLVQRAPTTIEVTTSVDSSLWNEESPYYDRTPVSAWIWSTTRFDRITVTHLGFQAYRHGHRQIQRLGTWYRGGAELYPNCGIHAAITPFGITLRNVGDSFCQVGVRLRGGMSQCKLTILQEKHQPRPPRDVSEFIELEGVWYATVTINVLQKLRIEEL